MVLVLSVWNKSDNSDVTLREQTQADIDAIPMGDDQNVEGRALQQRNEVIKNEEQKDDMLAGVDKTIMRKIEEDLARKREKESKGEKLSVDSIEYAKGNKPRGYHQGKVRHLHGEQKDDRRLPRQNPGPNPEIQNNGVYRRAGVRNPQVAKRTKEETQNMVQNADMVLGETTEFLSNGTTDEKDIPEILKALQRLRKEYGDMPNLKVLEHHLKVLQTREFPKKAREESCNKCNVYKYKQLIQPWNVCQKPGNVELLILITTIPSTIQERLTVRKTWGSHSKNNSASTRLVFLFGGGWEPKDQAIIEEENELYGDILQDDFKDAYYNLSYKVIMAYKWALEECPHARYVLRTADDNFIHVPRMLELLRRQGDADYFKRAQIGRRLDGLAVERKRTRKWYISPMEYKNYRYPLYAVGTAFLYSMESVREVVVSSVDVPFFCLEDAWLGMVMEKIQMPVIHVKGFHVNLEGEPLLKIKEGKCPVKGNFYSLHLVTTEIMYRVWKICPGVGTERLIGKNRAQRYEKPIY